MWYLPHNYLRVASALAVLVFVPVSVAAANASAPSDAKLDPAAAARLSSTYGKLPISFEANHGQTDGSVQFLARGAGYTLFLAPGEAVLSLHAPHVNANKPGSVGGPSALRSPARKLDATLPSSTVRLQLVGANTEAKAEGVDPLPGNSNYFVGSDPAKWHTDVPTYAKVRYSNVYPGIDLLYYGNQEGRLEHDFVVAPGADPNAIAIGLRDRGAAVLDQDGSLRIRTAAGSLILETPVVYQAVAGGRRDVVASYAVSANDEIRLSLGAYDHTSALVIDPVLRYAGVIVGSVAQFPQAIAVDGAGAVYITGSTDSNDFPVVNPFQASNAGGGTSAFVAKINPAGTALVYSTYLGAYAVGNGIAVDSIGRASVVGSTGEGFSMQNAYQPTYGGVQDAFLTVFSPSGNSLVNSTYLGGGGRDDGYAIALDAMGNTYIAGRSYAGFPTLHSFAPEGSVFVAKFNPSYELQFSTVFGKGWTFLDSIAGDTSGFAYVTGTTTDASFPTTPGAFQRVFPSKTFPFNSTFVTKLSLSGASLVYSTFLDGPQSVFSSVNVRLIAVDTSGNAYIAGTASSGFPVTQGAFQRTFGGGKTDYPTDGFITKLNRFGTGLIYSTYLGGNGNENVYSLALDQYRQVYVAGQTDSGNFPLKAPIEGFIYRAGDYQDFVTTLSSSGTSIVYYSTYWNQGEPTELGPLIAVDKALNLYMTGATAGSIKPTPGALSAFRAANTWNVYVSKLVIMDDIALGVSASAGTVAHGGNLTYAIAVTGKGPDFGYNVRISDPLPAGTTFVSYDAGGGTCTAPAVGGTGTLKCEVLRLEKGGTYTVKLTVNVNAAAGTKLSNTATSVSNMQDFVPGNNTGTLTTMVN